MTRDEYKAQRDALMSSATSAIEAGELDKGDKIMSDIEALDEQYRTAKIDALNAQALSEPEPVNDIMNFDVTNKINVREVKAKMTNEPVVMTRDGIIASETYRTAWLKNLMGKGLTTEERTALDGGTSSAGYAIPTITQERIIENMVQIAPLLGEIDLMQIPGNVSIAVESTVNAAAIHVEAAAITPAADTLTRITLGGYELAKLLSVSARLDEMAIAAFENWIVSNLSRKLAELMENYLVNGTGSSQPKGIDAAETWTDGTNAVDWASTAPTLAELVELVGYLNGAYAGNAKWLMNWKTYWTQIYPLRDEKNPSVLNGMNLLGFPIILSAKVNDDDIFFGDYHEGVKANLSAPVRIESDRSSGFRSNAIDYRGTCVFDSTTVAGRIVKTAPTL